MPVSKPQPKPSKRVPPKRDAVALALEAVSQTYDFKPLSPRAEKLLATWDDAE